MSKSKKCNMKTCRFNENGQCTNEVKREQCVEVSEKVLCINSVADE